MIMKMTILSLLILFSWKIVNAKVKSLHLMEQLCAFSQFNIGSHFSYQANYENSVEKKLVKIFPLSVVNCFIQSFF